MTKFTDIQKILEDGVLQTDIGVHGNFWRTTRDKFIETPVRGCKIIATDACGKFVGPESPLVKILREDGIICPLGTEPRPRMPFFFEPIPEEKIQIISDWIDAQCPE